MTTGAPGEIHSMSINFSLDSKNFNPFSYSIYDTSCDTHQTNRSIDTMYASQLQKNTRRHFCLAGV